MEIKCTQSQKFYLKEKLNKKYSFETNQIKYFFIYISL